MCGHALFTMICTNQSRQMAAIGWIPRALAGTNLRAKELECRSENERRAGEERNAAREKLAVDLPSSTALHARKQRSGRGRTFGG